MYPAEAKVAKPAMFVAAVKAENAVLMEAP